MITQAYRSGQFVLIGYISIKMTFTPVKCNCIYKLLPNPKTHRIKTHRNPDVILRTSKNLVSNPASQNAPLTDGPRSYPNTHRGAGLRNAWTPNSLNVGTTNKHIISYRIISSWTIFSNWASLHRNDAYAFYMTNIQEKRYQIQNQTQ